MIDTSYEALEDLARRQRGTGPERGAHVGVTEPELTGFLPEHTRVTDATDAISEGYLKALAQVLYEPLAIKNIADATSRPLELVHPWALSPRAADDSAFRLGVIHLPAHASWPWSARRWAFVLQAMSSVTDAVWAGDLTMLDLSASAKVTAQATLFPGYRQALAAVGTLRPEPRLLPSPAMACRSFSKFYSRVRQDDGEFADLL